MPEPKTGREMLADAYLELVKATISIPIDGCKSMAIGCPTVAALYGALLAFLVFGSHPHISIPQSLLISAPLWLFGAAGLAFSTAVLPNEALYLLLPEDLDLYVSSDQRKTLLVRERHVHYWRMRGTWLFWGGIVSGLLIITFDHLPTS